MSALGWLTMILCVGGVTSFLSWCIYMVVANPESTGHLHTQADIEPPDVHKDKD